jgi:hypothetical protein
LALARPSHFQIPKGHCSTNKKEDRGGAENTGGGAAELVEEEKPECTIYKGWVDCLNEAYTTRIAELEKKIEGQIRVVKVHSESGCYLKFIHPIVPEFG